MSDDDDETEAQAFRLRARSVPARKPWEPVPMTPARVMKMAATAVHIRAVARATRAGEYGDPPWLNAKIADWLESEARKTHERVVAFEAQGGFDRVRARYGGTR